MSGHSKWSTIKRHKGAQDAKRSKIFTKLIKEITISARRGGGDPNGNPRLRRAIDAAKIANMPSDNMMRAIKKGTGELEGVQYEELLYEGVGPAGTLFLCEIVTDNRNRTAAEIRKVFDKNGGQLGSGGSAAWAFEQKGMVKVPSAAVTEEQLFELAADAGAEDIVLEDDAWSVTTARDALDAVRDALESSGLSIAESSLVYIANNAKTVEGDDARQLLDLFDALDEHDDIQQVFADFELSEAALAELE
ncbi:MAG: YebC/PmpR family DNA-binding transcriptional regulator [Polyangiales bacterium]